MGDSVKLLLVSLLCFMSIFIACSPISSIPNNSNAHHGFGGVDGDSTCIDTNKGANYPNCNGDCCVYDSNCSLGSCTWELGGFSTGADNCATQVQSNANTYLSPILSTCVENSSGAASSFSVRYIDPNSPNAQPVYYQCNQQADRTYACSSAQSAQPVQVYSYPYPPDMECLDCMGNCTQACEDVPSWLSNLECVFSLKLANCLPCPAKCKNTCSSQCINAPQNET